MLFAEDAIKVDGHLFLFANNFNMLFSVDLSNGNMSFIGSIPEENIFSKRLTCKLVYWEKKIIVVPLLAGKIWMYSLENGEWKGLAIEDCRINGQGTYFRQAIIHKNSLFLVGGHYPAILKMDLLSYKLTYLREPFLNCTKSGELGELYFRGDYVYKEGVLYLASGRENLILVYQLDTQTYKWIEIGKKGNRYSGIMWDGNNYWLSPRINTSIVKWDGNNGVIEYEIPVERRVNCIAYAGVIKKENQIIIPALARSGADTIILTSDGKREFDNRKYTFYKKTEEGDYISQSSDGRILFIGKDGIRREYRCDLSGDRFFALLDTANIDRNDIAKAINKENDPFSLYSLLNLVGQTDVGLAQDKQNAGFKIWKMMKLQIMADNR